MRLLLTLLAFALVLAPGCGSRSPSPTPFKVRHAPPASKDVIEAVIAHASLPLSSDASCQGAGTQPEDANLGQYLSGFLSELSNPEARNAVTTSVEPTSDGVWVCRLMIRHAQGEDVWSWGVEFSVRRSDSTVIPSSFRCLGAG